jgi:hypothetical protein
MLKNSYRTDTCESGRADVEIARASRALRN